MTTSTEPQTEPGCQEPIAQALAVRLGADRVSDRLLDRWKMSHDGSHYHLIPQVVVVARDTQDVARTMATAQAHGVPLTFRSGGTSLSGQAGGRGVLVDTRRHFRDIEVLQDGALVRCRPGATVRAVNTRLAPYRRALGPDPASESACTIGGVIANNSSGMACGTTTNTYRTLDSLQVVLTCGTVLDTARPDADDLLRARQPHLWEGLMRLRDRIRDNPTSVTTLRHQFSMKNTMGYGLNSFLDHDSPAQILAHLMIGSEGTLGFVASATYRTVPVYPHVATALLVFDGIAHATDALGRLNDAGARTAELMDPASLRVSQAGPVRVPHLDGLRIDRHTALLVEVQEEQREALQDRLGQMAVATAGLPGLSGPARFTSDPGDRARVWSVRKGLYTAVAGARPPGSTALLEDIVVPLERLTSTVERLGALCRDHDYDDAVIFGHARDGNLHFMINPDLSDSRQLQTYAAFTDRLVDLVLGMDGSLKAEHGTGRIMAPFVRRQFGDELYAVMWQVKNLLDPDGLLNPGVVLGSDDQAHLRDLKVSPPVDPLVDRCVECGYCEPVCPSRDLTTTPRQRIALLRDLAVAPAGEAARVRADYDYEAVQTCAADSMCAGACPVGIDTGLLMKSHRAQQHSRIERAGALASAQSWGRLLPLLRAGVGAAVKLPPGVLGAACDVLRSAAPHEVVPALGADLPGPGRSRRTTARREPAQVVLFASCIGELFGPGDPTVPSGVADCAGQEATGRTDPSGSARAFLTLCDRAGITVRLPDSAESLCCATVWRSKGFVAATGAMAARTARALLHASREGAVPVVSDASSCTHGLHELGRDLRAVGEDALADRVGNLVVVDAVQFVRDHVLERLPAHPLVARAIVHPTCSDYAAGGVPTLLSVAARVAHDVVLPPDAGCCGFAGDRGLLHPELTASATRAEAADVAVLAQEPLETVYVSTNRTCEWGMSRATGRTYRHVLEVLADLTR